MKILNVFLFSVVLLAIACRPDKPSEVKDNQTIKNTINVKAPVSDKTEIIEGDYTFLLKYNSKVDQSSLISKISGKQIDKRIIPGRIKNNFTADINQDKHKEIYLTSHTKNGKSVLTALNLTDKHISDIYKLEVRDSANIVGASSYSIIADQLVESFEYSLADGSKKTKQLFYNIVAGEAAHILKPQGWTSSELENLLGQYASRDEAQSGYYKVLQLKKNETGEWIVEIRVKYNGSKHVICEFIGVGSFIDKDLFVPLNYQNPKLKGQLQIRFVGLNAIVFTEQSDDAPEMAAICGGEGSIAGNFKKTEL